MPKGPWVLRFLTSQEPEGPGKSNRHPLLWPPA